MTEDWVTTSQPDSRRWISFIPVKSLNYDSFYITPDIELLSIGTYIAHIVIGTVLTYNKMEVVYDKVLDKLNIYFLLTDKRIEPTFAATADSDIALIYDRRQVFTGISIAQAKMRVLRQNEKWSLYDTCSKLLRKIAY